MIEGRFNRQIRSKSVLIIVLISFVVASAGCEPLRKKFTRKKKEEKVSEFVPILDPIEYPAIEHTPAQEYAQYYSLWNVWQKEFLQEIDADDNEKRQEYLLGEAVSKLEEMKKLLSEKKRGDFDVVLNKYKSAQEAYEAPKQMRRTAVLKADIQRAGRTMREQFTPKLMEPYFESN